MKTHRLRFLLVCALALLLGAAHVAVGAPANDDCANAEPVGDVTDLAFDTTEATFDGPGHYIFAENIWYCYTATCTGCVTVSLIGSSYDTMLAVYDGNDCYPALEDLIEYNDDFYGHQSKLTFPAVAGNKYLIEVGGYYWTGAGVLSISCDPQPCQPPNDDCEHAKQISGNVTNLSFNTRWATFDGPGHCMTSANIWYRYKAHQTADVTVSLCGSIYDTKLAVYKGFGCDPALDDLVDCNDDACDLQSEITFAATAGKWYLIEVGGYSSETGQGLMTITCEGGPPPVSNDDCNDAEPVGNVTNMMFDTNSATFDGPGHCMVSPNIWYCYTATCTGDVTVSLCGSGYDTMLAVYDGNDCYPSQTDLVGCNDDFCGWQSQVTFPAVAGGKYLIEVGGYSYQTGQGVMSITCQGPVTNTDLGDAPDSTNNHCKIMHAYPSQGMLPVLVKANFPTVFDDGSGTGPYGPIHLNEVAVAHLGDAITQEIEADIGADQDGVNNIDPPADVADQDNGDDGVIFPLNMPHCRWAKFDYIVNVTDPGAELWVNVWCDWNRDGDWDDTVDCPRGPAPEWAVQNQYLFGLMAGLNQITTPAFVCWHPPDGPEEMWMRITLSEQPWTGGTDPEAKGNGGSGPQAGYEIGETEDYYFAPDTSCSICEDLNGDGVVDMQDLVLFVTEWLNTCR